MFARNVCVADMAESLFETKIGKIVFWPIYAAITIAIIAVAALCGKIISKVK